MSLLWIGLLVALGPTMWFDWSFPSRQHVITGNLGGLEATSARCFYNLRVAVETSKWRICESLVSEEASPAKVEACMDEGGWKSEWWPDDSNVQATGSDQFESALLSILLTTFTYFTRIAKIVRPLSVRLRSTVRNRASQWLLRRLANTNEKQKIRWSWTRKIYFRVQVSFYLVSSSYMDVISSEISDVSTSNASNPIETLKVSISRCYQY